MLQVHTFHNTDELIRLHKEGELPPGDIVGKVQRYMAAGKGILILLREVSSWEVRGIFVNIANGEDRADRTIFTIFSDLEVIDPEIFRTHLRTNHFPSAALHLPSTVALDGVMATWRVMRHRKQAVGVLETFMMQEARRIEKDVKTLTAHGETSRLEIHISRPVRKAEPGICKRLALCGFVTRKYIYHLYT